MIDRFPKKPCKLCKQQGHFTYQCRLQPKKELKRTPIQRSQKPLKRTPIKRAGKHSNLWQITRAKWIAEHPPTIRGEFWECYLQIHEWCPKLVSIKSFTLDHVISRSRAPALRYDLENLRPACIYCNELKGSRSLEDVKSRS